MKVSFVRHGNWDRVTGGLTLAAHQQALEKRGNYDLVLSSTVWRCIQTAHILGCGRDIITYPCLGGLPADNVRGRIQWVDALIRPMSGVYQKILIVSHSNLIAALKFFNEKRQIPRSIVGLPLIPNLEGFETYI